MTFYNFSKKINYTNFTDFVKLTNFTNIEETNLFCSKQKKLIIFNIILLLISMVIIFMNFFHIIKKKFERRRYYYIIAFILDCFALFIYDENIQIYDILYNILINTHKKLEKSLNIKFNKYEVQALSNFDKEKYNIFLCFNIHIFLYLFIIYQYYRDKYC